MSTPTGFIIGAVLSAGANLTGGAGRATSYGGNLLLPNAALPMEEYLHLYQQRWIGSGEFTREMRELGYKVENTAAEDRHLFTFKNGKLALDIENENDIPRSMLDRWLVYAKNVPDKGTITDMVQRKLVDDEAARYMFNMHNSGELALTDIDMKLVNELPNVDQATQWAAMGIADDTLVGYFGLNKEQSRFAEEFADKNGWGYRAFNGVVAGGTYADGTQVKNYTSFSDIIWQGHWHLPNYQVGWELTHRNYDTSLYGANPNIPADIRFSQGELETLYRVNNIPPNFRRKLDSLKYRPLSFRVLNHLYAKNLLRFDSEDKSLFHAFKANGYSDSDADKLCRLAVLTARQDVVDLSVSQIREFYKDGIISRQVAIEKMQALYYPVDQAELFVQNVDLEVLAEDTKFFVDKTKGAFLGGDINTDMAVAILTNFGLQPAKVNYYLNQWQFELRTSHKYVQVNQAIAFFKNGLVNEQQLRNKLTWLHYRADETELIITNAKFEILQRTIANTEKTAKQLQTQQAKIDRQQEKANKELTKQLNAASKAKQKAIGTISKEEKSPYSEKNLIAFAGKGYLTYGQLVKILEDKGWLIDDINRWVLSFTPKVKGIPNVIKEKYDA